MSEPVPTLRPCPFCKAHGHEKVTLMQHSVLWDDGIYYDIEHSVKCTECGAQVCAEYQSEVVNLWNGVQGADDDDTPSPAVVSVTAEVDHG